MAAGSKGTSRAAIATFSPASRWKLPNERAASLVHLRPDDRRVLQRVEDAEISIAWFGAAIAKAMRFQPGLKAEMVPPRKTVGKRIEATCTTPTGGVSGLLHRTGRRTLGVASCVSLCAQSLVRPH